MTYLLLYEKLPTAPELAEWRTRMRASRDIPIEVQIMVRTFPANAHPMQLLQSIIAYLSVYIDHTIQHSPQCNCRDTLHQIVQMASVIATYHRFRQGKGYVQPLPTSLARGQLPAHDAGTEPEEYEARIMDACLVLHAEHEFNASTFTARVVASTMSTCYCSIAAAIGALFGSLHGGANERVLDMVQEIGTQGRRRTRGWTRRSRRSARCRAWATGSTR